MSDQKVVNRQFELNFLNQTYKLVGFKCVLLYGRRRIGKTELIKEFIKDKQGIYFLCSKRSVEENITEFIHSGEQSGLPKIDAKNFREYFQKLKSKIDRKIIIFDEFQHLFKEDPSILYDFQYVMDEILAYTETMIILGASAFEMFRYIGFDDSSPLFGRFLQRLRLKELKIQQIINLHPKKSFNDIVKIYAAIGGVPFYHQFFQDTNFVTNIIATFFNTGHILNHEVEYLLSTEFKEMSHPLSILHAIGLGNTTTPKIAEYTGMSSNVLKKWLSKLIASEIVQKIVPVDHSPKSKVCKYIIIDNSFRFWFNFVDPLKSFIELGSLEKPLNFFRENYPIYLAYTIENLVCDLLKKSFPIIGKWWNKEIEIDLIGINHTKKEIIYCDINWENGLPSKDILDGLKRRSENFKKNQKYKTKYLIVSPQKAENSDMSEEVLFWDMKYLQELVTGKKL